VLSDVAGNLRDGSPRSRPCVPLVYYLCMYVCIYIYTDSGEAAIDDKLFHVKLYVEIANMQTIERTVSAIVIAVQQVMEGLQ
jgi:hypothetical protein